MNIFQKLNFNNNFVDSRVVRVFQSQVNPNKIVINGRFEGWVKPREIILNTFADFEIFASGGVYYGGPMTTLDKWIQPEFPLLQPIIKVQIFLGENTTALLKESACLQQNLRINAQDSFNRLKDQWTVAHLGPPFAVGKIDIDGIVVPAFTTLVLNTGSYSIAAAGPWANECVSQYDEWRYMFRYGNVPTNVAFGIPLWMFNPFFDNDCLLPEGLRFSIEIEYNNTAVTVAYNNYQLDTVSNGHQTFTMGLTGPWTMQYRAHKITRELSNTIMNKWINTPLMYEYESYIPIETIMTGRLAYEAQMTISQQRPLILLFKPTLNTAYNDVSTTVQQGVVQTYNSIPSTTFAGGTIPFFKFTYMYVYINGDLKYKYDFPVVPSNNQTTMPPQADTTEAMLTYSGQYSIDNKDNFIFSTPRGQSWNQCWAVTIDVGGLLQKGYKSTDEGAVTCKVVFNVTGATNLTSAYKMVVYKKYPLQAMINKDMTVDIAEWPALVSGREFMLAQTYNAN